MASHVVLVGLPATGPLPESFSPTGQGKHREGFVVRFETDDGQQWVGNFQPGSFGLDTVYDHPNGRDVLVIARGQGYLVDPNDRNKRDYFGGDIQDSFTVPELSAVVFGNGLWFEAIGSAGLIWRSERISWDGMRDLAKDSLRLFGEAWNPMQNCWVPFELDLLTGGFKGGSYSWGT
jgi:hypothetical protein